MNADVNGKRDGGKPGAENGAPSHFRFNLRRAPATGPRRLFTSQRRVSSTVFETRAQRPHAILRMISTSA